MAITGKGIRNDSIVIKYGESEDMVDCAYCKRPNHKDNTHCWYCKNRLDVNIFLNSKNILERLSRLEHIQWETWSMAIAKEIEKAISLIEKDEIDNGLHILEDRLHRWEKNWKEYKRLPNKVKEQDRVWARKVLEEFK